MRGLKIDDATDIYHLFSDPYVTQLDHIGPMTNRQEAESFIRMTYAHPDHLLLGIEQKDTGKIIGTCGFKNVSQASLHAEIGGNFSSAFWGKGYGTEALQAILDYGFTTLGLNKIYAQAICDNENVIKLLIKYGFTTEGRLRDHLQLNHAFTDLCIFSILEKEFST